MAITYSPNKALAELAAGDAVGTWGTNVNSNMTIIDNAFGGQTQLTLSNANVTVTATQAQNCYFTLNGTLTANVTVTFPAVGSFYIIKNNTFGNFLITLVSGAGTQIIVANGATVFAMNDSVNMVTVHNTFAPYFRLVSPNVSLPNNTIVTLGNYGGIQSASIDNNINLTSGIVTIGTNDAGLYNLTTTSGPLGPNETVTISILRNGSPIAKSQSPTPSAVGTLSTSVNVRLVAGDQVVATLSQINVSGNTDTVDTSNTSHFSGVRVAL